MRRIVKRMAVLAAAGLLAVTAAMPVFAATKERLATVEDTYWDDDDSTVARWEEVEDAYQYEVYLYCDESKKTSIKTKKNYYNFEKKMTSAGNYTFKVRALAKSSSSDYRDGLWSDESDDVYISESFAELMQNGGTIDTQTSGPGAKSEGTPTSEISLVYTPEWQQDATGWRYRMSDGSYPASTWWQDPGTGIWYYFNENTYMATGWVDWNGSWYYCDPSGAMVTGDHTIDGVQYHFDGSGAMIQ